jgi:hypothetical protein
MSLTTPRNISARRQPTADKENITPCPPRLDESTRTRSAPKISREALAFTNASSGYGRTARPRQEPASGKRKLEMRETAETPVLKKTRSSADVPTVTPQPLRETTNLERPQDRVLAPQSQMSSPLTHSHSSPSVLTGSQKLLSFRYKG